MNIFSRLFGKASEPSEISPLQAKIDKEWKPQETLFFSEDSEARHEAAHEIYLSSILDNTDGQPLKTLLDTCLNEQDHDRRMRSLCGLSCFEPACFDGSEFGPSFSKIARNLLREMKARNCRRDREQCEAEIVAMGPSAVPALSAALLASDRDDLPSHEDIVCLLERIKDPEAVPALAAYLDATSTGGVSDQLVRALTSLRWKPNNPMQCLKCAVATKDFAWVKNVWQQVPEATLSFIGVGNLAKGLAETGDPRVFPALVSALVEADESTDIPRNALAVLPGVKDSTIDILIQRLSDPATPNRCRIAEALYRMKDPRTVMPLIKIIQNEVPNPPVHKTREDWAAISLADWAARALGEIGDPRALQPLLTAFEFRTKTKEFLYQPYSHDRSIANALVQLHAVEAVPLLISRALGSESQAYDYAYKAIETLLEHGLAQVASSDIDLISNFPAAFRADHNYYDSNADAFVTEPDDDVTISTDKARNLAKAELVRRGLAPGAV